MTTPAEPRPNDNSSIELPRHAPICRSPKGMTWDQRPVPPPRDGVPPSPPAASGGVADGPADPDEPVCPNPELRVADPGEFVAAVPALLGFFPRRSLVACLLHEAPDRPDSLRLGSVARHDLDVPGRAAWARLAGQLTVICAQEQALAVLILIVDDRAGAPRAGDPGARSARHRELVGVLRGALEAEGVEVAEAVVVREITDEGLWWSLLHFDCLGLQSDPMASPIALAHVLDGRPIRASRAELEAVVAPDPHATAEVAAQLDAAVEEARRRYERAVRHCEPGHYSRDALELVLWLIATADSGGSLEPRELADLAVALRDSTVRDALFALAASDHANAAEAVWTRLCRCVDGDDRAEAATLLGYSAYLRGDGPLAGVALAAALAADPGHRIAALLDTALRTGLPPHEVRKLARSGQDRAASVGVELGIDPDRFDR
ncbi:DUF4192 family protein [Nocardia sp. CDC159]|uniref:DUF4192 family protein n=1 Tax=Nocardia pulmonis TaxID=2951408 RepID=A0A9X2E5Y4_9NOCA|nr:MULTISPECIES: DUF4192 family protein [Nocardia]MCM6774275.1 DUF4192 family protein [Nocardia pulmonis]MCM6787162.1 DUF4192 family protein [Nocardia sp. CDC159]